MRTSRKFSLHVVNTTVFKKTNGILMMKCSLMFHAARAAAVSLRRTLSLFLVGTVKNMELLIQLSDLISSATK